MTLHTCSTLLEPESLQDLTEFLMLADVGKLNVNAAAQPRAQVRRAGQNVSQVLVPHELVALLLKQPLDLRDKRMLDRTRCTSRSEG